MYVLVMKKDDDRRVTIASSTLQSLMVYTKRRSPPVWRIYDCRRSEWVLSSDSLAWKEIGMDRPVSADMILYKDMEL